MKTILQIHSSLFSTGGQSSRLANEFVAEYRRAHPGTKLILRDLGRDPVPHLDAARFGAFIARPEERDDAQAAVIGESDALIGELRRAEVLVLGLPMYNFGVPSQLKAWFDHVARAGETFRYTETGPVGLLSGKKAYVFATRGGLYAGTDNDSQTGYVRQFLAFLGITDVEFVYAEGLAISEERKQMGLSQAQTAIHNLIPEARLAA